MDIDSDEYPDKSGLHIPVDLDTLIDKIVLAPNCPSWQKTVIKSILKKYDVDKKVSSSTLYTRDERILY